MSSSCKSSVTSNLKPRNIFYVWYGELCRRSNTNPLSIVKPAKPKNDVVLDFIADRIKPEEWTPILNALCLDTSLHVIAIRSRLLGCNFRHEINTEEKTRRMKKQCGSLWTDYILRSLTKSLGCCIKTSQVLSSLELDGLPISMEYLELLLQNLRFNRTIKLFSLKHCPINDGGCQLVCTNLRLMPNITVLNLSSCNLSLLSGQYVGKIIKHQQLNRYCESWHNSLRYEEPESGTMGGIKRISLNNNPEIGDEGLGYILDALADDLWIKAVDMQNCGITEDMSQRLLNLVEQSSSLEVADFRHNENITSATIERILELFEKKYRFGNDPEFQWGVTTSTICDSSSFRTSRTNLSTMSGVIEKARSAPLRNVGSSEFFINGTLRRTKTLTMMERKSAYSTFMEQHNNKRLSYATKQLSQLHAQLQHEITKRMESEQMNNALQKQMVGINIRQLGNFQNDRCLTSDNKNKAIRIKNGLKFKDNEQVLPKNTIVLNKGSTGNNLKKYIPVTPQIKPKVVRELAIKPINKCPSVKPQEKQSGTFPLTAQALHEPITPNPILNKTLRNKSKSRNFPNLMSPISEVSTPSKSISDTPSNAQNLFERIVLQDNYNIDDREDETQAILQYYCDSDIDDTDDDVISISEIISRRDEKCSLSSGSTSSLETLYREMDAVDQDFNSRSYYIKSTFGSS